MNIIDHTTIEVAWVDCGRDEILAALSHLPNAPTSMAISPMRGMQPSVETLTLSTKDEALAVPYPDGKFIVYWRSK